MFYSIYKIKTNASFHRSTRKRILNLSHTTTYAHHTVSASYLVAAFIVLHN